MNKPTGYEDIIGLPHHVSERHPPMPAGDRAAQFSPFAALTGYGDVLSETVRETERKAELNEDRLEELDRLLCRLSLSDPGTPVIITYFIADRSKSGGKYVTLNTSMSRIDEARSLIITAEGTEIPIEDLWDIELI